MNLKPSPSAPQQVAFKRVCSTIYDAYGDQILVDGIDVTREYVVGRMLADLQMADAATLSRVLGVLEGVPARSAGRAPTRHYALALVALYLESASWDTLALVAETLHSNAGQVEPPGRPASPVREGVSFPVLASGVARLRQTARAAATFPLWPFIEYHAARHVAIPLLALLGLTLAVTGRSAAFLLVRLNRWLRVASRPGAGRRGTRGGYAPARHDNSRAEARANKEVSGV